MPTIPFGTEHEEAQTVWMDLQFRAFTDEPFSLIFSTNLYGYHCRLSQNPCKQLSMGSQTLTDFSPVKYNICLMKWCRLQTHSHNPNSKNNTTEQQKTVQTPTIFPAQCQLIYSSWAQHRCVGCFSIGLDVVRMLCSNPHYGLCIPPEKIIESTCFPKL